MVLLIDACVRTDSRTRRLAGAVLAKLGDDVETVELYKENIPALDEELLEWRHLKCEALDFSDDYFRFARQFAAADCVVIAAPYWDLSFPAKLKDYIECISINGLTFKYNEQGIPVGLCRAKKLVYVTTAGGPIIDDAFYFGYIAGLAKGMLGIKECELIKAEGLDIFGNDPEAILAETIKSLQNKM